MESNEWHFPDHFQFQSSSGHKWLPNWFSSSKAGDKEMSSLDWTDSSTWRYNKFPHLLPEPTDHLHLQASAAAFLNLVH